MPIQKITKKELIQKSIAVFRTKGYYRTSMSDLSVACGLTKGAFYHYFASKEEVMINCLSATADWFNRHIFLLAYEGDIAGEDKLKHMAQAILQAFTTESGGCFFANTILETAHVEATFTEIIKGFFDNWEKALIHIYSSRHSPEVARELSLKTIAEIEGSIILMQLHQNVSYLEAAIKRCLAYY